jgi:hypothetical protein
MELVLVNETQAVLQPQDITAVIVEQDIPTIVQASQQGPAGPAGDSYTSLNVIAGADLLPYTAVTISVIPGNTPFLGINMLATLSGTIAEVQQTGYITNPLWTWTPLQPVYANVDGSLTQVRPTGTGIVIIGYASTPTKLYVKQEPTIQDALQFTKRTEFETDYTIYQGYALPGTLETDPSWLITYTVIDANDNVSLKYADGSDQYNKTWTSRATYTYI